MGGRSSGVGTPPGPRSTLGRTSPNSCGSPLGYHSMEPFLHGPTPRLNGHLSIYEYGDPDGAVLGVSAPSVYRSRPMRRCMPLYWTIDSKERLFIAVGEGDVTLDDAMSLLEAQAGAGAISYRKLFDGRAMQCSMTGDEILAVCVKVRASHEHAQVGAL